MWIDFFFFSVFWVTLKCFRSSNSKYLRKYKMPFLKNDFIYVKQQLPKPTCTVWKNNHHLDILTGFDTFCGNNCFKCL